MYKAAWKLVTKWLRNPTSGNFLHVSPDSSYVFSCVTNCFLSFFGYFPCFRWFFFLFPILGLTDTPALVASAIDDVSQSELLIVENEIKKSTQVKRTRHHQCPRKNQNRLEDMLWCMESKLPKNVSIKFIQSILFLEHPSRIQN